SRRRHTRSKRDWSSDVCSSDLKSPGLELARSVGVVKPEKIRIGVVDRLPMPTDSALREAAVQTGLLGPGMIGLTLGYAVLICRRSEERRVGKECRVRW